MYCLLLCRDLKLSYMLYDHMLWCECLSNVKFVFSFKVHGTSAGSTRILPFAMMMMIVFLFFLFFLCFCFTSIDKCLTLCYVVFWLHKWFAVYCLYHNIRCSVHNICACCHINFLYRNKHANGNVVKVATDFPAKINIHFLFPRDIIWNIEYKDL